MSNPFEDLRQAVVVRPMNSPGPQGAAAPHMKIRYSADSVSWHNDPVETDKYLSFSTDNGITWSDAIYFNNLSETLDWVEKARQWAENPENYEVEPGQYSALHHALQAKKSEITAGEYAVDAASSAAEAFGAAAPAWDSEIVYNYNDVVSFDNGHTYRCVGINVVGEDHAPNINGVDNVEEWTRITVALDGYFEIDENGDLIPMLVPITSEIFMLDENGDITYQEDIDLEPGGAIELYGKTEFVDSIADLRSSSFYGTTEYVYVAGYYGAGTPGGGMFYRDVGSFEADNGGTVIVDSDNVRWKRANVHEEYYASWFGVSTDITDNSPLIQNALNVIPSGSILIFGPGEYRCQQTITIPDNPNIPDELKYLTLQGSQKLPSAIQQNRTMLRYTGPNPSTLTPLIDFRGSTGDKRFTGSIRNMIFWGLGSDKNVVGLWFHDCVGSLFDSVFLKACKYGIQIDNYYYYCKFNDVVCTYCDYGFRGVGTASLANGAAFNYCTFSACNVGFASNSGGYWNTGMYLNNCYLEGNKTAIDAMVESSLYINGCYFEGNSEYVLSVSCPFANKTPLVIINNSYIHLSSAGLTPYIAVIKQDVHDSNVVSYDIRNNSIRNTSIGYDYFIYVESGGIVIKAENNKLKEPSASFPICSTTPSQSSYFNNHFSS